MPGNLIDDVRALAELVRRETGTLSMPLQGHRHERIAAAKASLIGAIESRTARLAGQRPDWKEALPADQRKELAEAVNELRRASESRIGMRTIELPAKLFPAILANPSSRQEMVF